MSRQNQKGQAVPFVVLFMFVAMIMVLIVVWLGDTAAFRAKAQAAADSAALAGAVGGERAASREAVANKAVLTRFERIGNDVRVIVRLGKVAATARARNDSAITNKSLAPAFRASVARAESISNQKVLVVHSSDQSIEVTSGTAQWLAPLSDSTGLCAKSSNLFAICG
jgi:hypothetical protein